MKLATVWLTVSLTRSLFALGAPAALADTDQPAHLGSNSTSVAAQVSIRTVLVGWQARGREKPRLRGIVGSEVVEVR